MEQPPPAVKSHHKAQKALIEFRHLSQMSFMPSTVCVKVSMDTLFVPPIYFQLSCLLKAGFSPAEEMVGPLLFQSRKDFVTPQANLNLLFLDP